jgi:hypothetical protein
VTRGERWRADHEIVRRRPDLFIPDGSTRGEEIAARNAAGIHYA